MSRLSEQLKSQRESIEAPQLLPVGTYTWKVVGQYQETESEKWNILQIPLVAVEAHEDVDEDWLVEFGSISNVRTRLPFFFPKDEEDKNSNERTVYDLERFLKACGLEQEANETLEEGLSRTVNCLFAAQVSHKQDRNDPERFNLQLGTPTALE